MAVCYRHPSRETGVACSNCGRPICPDCMTPTSVGMRCPECARQRTKVTRVRARSLPSVPLATRVLVALNVVVFLGEVATGTPLGGVSASGIGTLYTKGALWGPLITQSHQYYRLLTAGFLHDGLLHILFNMWFLYVMGALLEPAIGRLNFVIVYFVSLLAGSFGALLFTPDGVTVGASGACFGILGALMVVAHDRGMNVWRGPLGLTLIINIVFDLTVPGISIGGHLAGVVAGALCGWLIVRYGERRGRQALVVAGCAAVAVVSVVGAIAVAGSTGLAPNGITL
ncbi:MAG TPA: rhomboid family intramembrane serine protease [Solirubrobacteraceae bacterium]|nr:rhomboid family intramembrane serine protease [Solirubrobacteraceae bacterium]